MEPVEGELGRFTMIRGEEPTQIYNRLNTNALNGPLPLHEPQIVALKATSSMEALPCKIAQVEAAGFNKEEMALIIKRFETALKGRKEYPNKNKSRGKRSCFKCGKSGHFIAQCLDNNYDQAQEKHGKKERKKNYRKAKSEAHIGKEWDSRVENRRKKSRPDPYRFLHLTPPFSYLQKNMETGEGIPSVFAGSRFFPD
jgi:hypothetical protein